MLATSKHVFKIKTGRNLFKNYDFLFISVNINDFLTLREVQWTVSCVSKRLEAIIEESSNCEALHFYWVAISRNKQYFGYIIFNRFYFFIYFIVKPLQRRTICIHTASSRVIASFVLKTLYTPVTVWRSTRNGLDFHSSRSGITSCM